MLKFSHVFAYTGDPGFESMGNNCFCYVLTECWRRKKIISKIDYLFYLLLIVNGTFLEFIY